MSPHFSCRRQPKTVWAIEVCLRRSEQLLEYPRYKLIIVMYPPCPIFDLTWKIPEITISTLPPMPYWSTLNTGNNPISCTLVFSVGQLW